MKPGWVFFLFLAGCSANPAQLPSPIPPKQTPAPRQLAPPPSPDPNTRIRKIERHALAAPVLAEKDIPSLSRYLVKGCQNDQEKALAIYAWVTSKISYDHEVAEEVVDRTDQSAVATLRRRDGVCEGFSLLYRDLARAAGLQAEEVDGHIKSWDKWVVGDDDYHAWNAVYWDGRWHLLDCTWDEGYLYEDDPAAGLPRYFDVPPEQMLASHFPDEPAWQLRIRPPMTPRQFIHQCRTSPTFYRLGLECLDHEEYLLRFVRERTLRLRVPAGVVVRAQLRQNDKPISRGGVLISRRGDMRAIEVRPPRPGSYTLMIWARRSYELQSSLVLSYQLKSSLPAECWPAYPETGPDYLAEQVLIQEPTKGVLKPGTQHFQILAPGALSLVVNTGGKRLPLQKDGDNFAGDCTLATGFAQVEGIYSQDDRHRPLLFFKVNKTPSRP